MKVCSIGFVLPRGTPVVWRGPMIGTAVRQLLHDVNWGELDYLLIDLPPGTSDASMSMSQEAPISGVVIVSTPQDVALEDAAKAVGDVRQAQRAGLRRHREHELLRLSALQRAHRDLRSRWRARRRRRISGWSSSASCRWTRRRGAPRDEGEPIVVAAPESAQAEAFIEVAKKVAARCSVLEYAAGA